MNPLLLFHTPTKNRRHILLLSPSHLLRILYIFACESGAPLTIFQHRIGQLPAEHHSPDVLVASPSQWRPAKLHKHPTDQRHPSTVSLSCRPEQLVSEPFFAVRKRAVAQTNSSLAFYCSKRSLPLLGESWDFGSLQNEQVLAQCAPVGLGVSLNIKKALAWRANNFLPSHTAPDK